MKNTHRIIPLLLVLLLSTSAFAYAETIDLSALSYDELVALKNQINLAMWNSQEWQEVTVPQGVWIVGKDIPAGHWTVTCADGVFRAQISWGERLADNNERIAYYGRYSVLNRINNPVFYETQNEYRYSYSFEVRDGEYIVIEYGAVVFTPYTGKPDLGFK